jgi:hypothetical protein
MLLLYDRLLHNGGLSGTSTVAQTVGGTLTRNTGGVGNIIFLEIYTQVGATATTIEVSYTNQGGTSGQITPAISFGGTGLREAQRLIPVPLASGDTGVQAVASVDLVAGTGTGGNFGVTIARPIAYIPINIGGVGGWRDFVTGLPGIPKLDAGSCLSLAFFSHDTTNIDLFFGGSIVEA